MAKIKTIQNIIMNIDIEIKDKQERKKELEILKKYVQKSNIFNGKKKKIYALINSKKRSLQNLYK